MAVMRPPSEEKKRSPFLEVFDGIELLAYGFGALVVLVVVLFVGIRSAHRVGGPLASGAAIGATIGVTAVVARDAIRKRWSPVSVGVGALYALCFGALIAAEVFVG